MPSRTLPVRLEEELISRLDELAEALTRKAAGVKVTRASAIRVALERGLDALHAELGEPRRTKPKGK